MMINWLVEPFQFSFMTRAFLGTSLIALLAAMIGVFIVLKGLAFIGDAIAHTSFAGIALSLLFGWNLYVGALILALVTAVGITFLNRTAKVRNDTALAILFTGAFALGIILMTTMPSYAGDLSALLLGSVLAIRSQELYFIVVAVVVVGIVLKVTYHHLVFVVFDPVGAEAAGISVLGFQLLLMIMIGMAVVVSLQTVGVILVMALLITPAATAAIFTRRIGSMMLLASLLGLLATWVGLYISYYFAAPPGATIVLIATAEFALALMLSKVRARLIKVHQRSALKERI